MQSFHVQRTCLDELAGGFNNLLWRTSFVGHRSSINECVSARLNKRTRVVLHTPVHQHVWPFLYWPSVQSLKIEMMIRTTSHLDWSTLHVAQECSSICRFVSEIWLSFSVGSYKLRTSSLLSDLYKLGIISRKRHVTACISCPPEQRNGTTRPTKKRSTEQFGPVLQFSMSEFASRSLRCWA
jgi:hypothetical protein